MKRRGEVDALVLLAVVAVVLVLILIPVGCWAVPTYNVWSSARAGEAELAQAEYSRKIKTVEAQAAMDSAKSLA